MSHADPSLPPRSTPLTVKLAYGQMLLAAAAFSLVPLYALHAAYFRPAPVLVAVALEDEGAEAESALPALVAADATGDPITRGEAIFGQSCAACHQPTGTGIPGVFPPLAGSDYLLADADRAVGVVLNGLVGPVTVNGVDYQSAMPPMPLADDDAAAVVSYILQAWGNQGPRVTAADVARVRAATTHGG